ncbi:MAG: gluconate 2-dehydrogenase subunit 3 family protein [Vicinamibacteraceae bacterium]
MSEITRRDALQRLTLAIAAAGVIDALDAREAHAAASQAAAAAGGRYVPKALSAHEFATLERLTDLIVPADDKPGALLADVAPWIDTLLNVNADLKAKYVAGLAWLDTAIAAGGAERAKDFVSATPAQQTAMLDVIAFRKNRTAGNETGVDFFVLARRMTCDGFYTSMVGMRDVYVGNAPQAAFVVPQAAIDHVISRSPLK